MEKNRHNLAPIVLFVYNRPWHTKQTVEALVKNKLACKSELFIFSDAEKNHEATEKVNEVRKYISIINGFKNIKIIKRTENYGLAKSITSGVSEVVNKYGKVIVLEDDIVVSRYFLKYMNEALNKYKNEQNVISIHGYIYTTKKKLPSSFFLKGADCWGWATWKRGWKLFENDGSILLNKIKKQKLIREFNFNHSYPYLKMLRDQIKGKNDSWAIRWYASAFLNNKLTLYPGRSLVQNIGFDGTGNHCTTYKISKNFNHNQSVKLHNIPISENKEAKKAVEYFFWKYRLSIINRAVNKLKQICKKLKKS